VRRRARGEGDDRDAVDNDDRNITHETNAMVDRIGDDDGKSAHVVL
jgi:hypothetical protein